jgi:hypothetical protein
MDYNLISILILPNDILYDILNRLPYVDLVMCHHVCSKLRSLLTVELYPLVCPHSPSIQHYGTIKHFDSVSELKYCTSRQILGLASIQYDRPLIYQHLQTHYPI